MDYQISILGGSKGEQFVIAREGFTELSQYCDMVRGVK
jgi:hypothetical protein